MNLCVLGAQWGDEGKGKIVDLLTPRFDIVARYQGGHNAGPYRLRQRHEVRPPAHSVRHPASRRHLRHRQRRRHRSAARCSPKSTSWRRMASRSGRGSSSATRRTSSSRTTATSICCRRRGAANGRSGRPRAASGPPTKTRSPVAGSGSAILPTRRDSNRTSATTSTRATAWSTTRRWNGARCSTS